MSLWSKTDAQASKPKYLHVGQLVAINVTGTMSGYTSGSFTIGAPNLSAQNGGVQATATYVAAGGVITSVTITNPGAGYTSAPTVTAAGGTGAVIAPKIAGNAKVAGPNQKIVFVDITEAQNAQNRAKGIKMPGWTKFSEYQDANGEQRYKVENLVAMAVTAGNAGDTASDDAIAGDAAFALTGPAATTTTTGGAATVAVVSAGSTFQWQVRQPAGGQYVNATGTIAGITYTNGTTATLSIAGATAPNAGTRYRCQVLNNGAAVVSGISTLAFGT